MRRRLLSQNIIIPFIILCAVVFIPSVKSFAAGMTMQEKKLEAKPGDAITVEVIVSDNPGVAAWLFDLSWDDNVFTYKKDSAAPGEKFLRGAFMDNQKDDNSLTLGWYNSQNCSEDGVLFSVQFEVKAGASSGEYRISVKDSKENIINEDEQEVEVLVNDIIVSVVGGANSTPVQNQSSDLDNKVLDEMPEDKIQNSGDKLTTDIQDGKQQIEKEDANELPSASNQSDFDGANVNKEPEDLPSISEKDSDVVTIISPGASNQQIKEKSSNLMPIVICGSVALTLVAGISTLLFMKKRRK